MMARDIVVRSDTAYVLAVGKELNSVRMAVYSATELAGWRVVFATDQLPAPTYSFEVVGDSIFFGLGGPNEHSGEIYRISIP